MLTEFAPAKVNLFLHLLAKRADGYHELESLFVFSDRVGDILRFEPGHALSLSLKGPEVGALADEDPGQNLILKAVRALAQVSGEAEALQGRYVLEKKLPVASGIGGGSADAAAALRLGNRLLAKPLPDEVLADLALDLGADVPACLTPSAQWVTGIGERREEVEGWPPMAAVLVNPRIGVSTGQVFKTRSQVYTAPMGFDPKAHWPKEHWPEEHWPEEHWPQLIRATHNDLQQAAEALEPQVASCLAALTALGTAWHVAMSGSGATCFALFDDLDQAQQAQAKLLHQQPGWWCQATHLI